MAARRRVLIIGLDGFTWTLGRGLVGDGVMPELARLAEEGASGVLRSVLPPETAPAWTSFQTGCYPGKTGVFTFHVYDRQRQSLRLNSFADIAAPTLWELADGAGKTVVSLNLPMTSPPPKVKGVIIPGLMCPELSAATVHPAEAYEKYIAGRNEYRIVNSNKAKTVRQFVDEHVKTESAREAVALELMREVDWDVFCVQIQSSDHVQHHIWPALDRSLRQHWSEEYEEGMRFYRRVDELIGKVTEAAGDDVLTLIVSDHGFMPMKGALGINAWLRERGYMKVQRQGPSEWSRRKEAVKTAVPGMRALARLYGKVRELLPARSEAWPEEMLAHLAGVVDVGGSEVICLGSMAGLLYIRGGAQERERIGEKLCEQLWADFGDDSALPLIERINKGQEVFGGSEHAHVPDLVVGYCPGGSTLLGPMSKVLTKPSFDERAIRLHASHSMDGVLVVHGSGVRSGKEVNAGIVDVMPTVLAYMGMAVPRHVDGKVLGEAFAALPEVRYDDVSFKRPEKVDYTDQEQEALEKKLWDLGYM